MALGAALLAASSAGAQPLTCHGAEKPREVAELFFGRRMGAQGFISEGAFRRFVAREITPRFPDGLTVLETRGQWRDPGGTRTIREPSNLVIIAMPGRPEDHDHLAQIAEAYKKKFRQQSVGIVVRPAYVSF